MTAATHRAPVAPPARAMAALLLQQGPSPGGHRGHILGTTTSLEQRPILTNVSRDGPPWARSKSHICNHPKMVGRRQSFATGICPTRS
eukprot:scaffold152239_cov32-Tisochrysis_lutea.AAC.3